MRSWIHVSHHYYLLMLSPNIPWMLLFSNTIPEIHPSSAINSSSCSSPSPLLSSPPSPTGWPWLHLTGVPPPLPSILQCWSVGHHLYAFRWWPAHRLRPKNRGIRIWAWRSHHSCHPRWQTQCCPFILDKWMMGHEHGSAGALIVEIIII